MRELFVWYRVAEPKAAAARAEVLRMQQALAADHPGLSARLLARDDGSAALQTWMETYACRVSPAGVDAALEGSIERRAQSLDGLIEGPRHTEAFQPVRG